MAHLERHTDTHPLSLGPPGAYHVHTDTQPPLRPKTWKPMAREEQGTFAPLSGLFMMCYLPYTQNMMPATWAQPSGHLHTTKITLCPPSPCPYLAMLSMSCQLPW